MYSIISAFNYFQQMWVVNHIYTSKDLSMNQISLHFIKWKEKLMIELCPSLHEDKVELL